MHQRTRLYIDALPLTTARTSGIGHMLAAIVRELGSRPSVTDNYEIILFGPRSGQERVVALGLPNVSYKALPFPRKVTTLLNFMHLLPAVDRFLGHGTYLFGNFVNYPLTGKSTSLTYVHDLCYLKHPEFLRPKVRRILTTHLKSWMKRTDKVVTVSEDGRSDIANFYPELAAKTVAVLNGVDLTHFRRTSPAEVVAIKTKYEISGDYVLFVGNIEPRKNLARLIRAFQNLPEATRANQSLVLVGGDGWLNEEIHAAIDTARAAGCSIIWPQTYVGDEDLPALYSGATAAILISVHEGFGMPLIESMACGTPVVASSIPSLKEVVGRAGCYVDPLDEADITAGLQSVISDPAKQKSLSVAGLAQVQQFSWAATVDDLTVVIDQISNRS